MLGPRHTPKPRRFDYEPRYYDSTEDDRFKRRLRFSSKGHRGKRPRFLFLVIVLALVLFIYLAF
jgi:hypothetical protein